MPTNALGIVLFATLLVPGFIHRETRRTLRPLRASRTGFEQTIEIVSVSLLANLIVGMLVVVARTIDDVEEHTPDLNELLRDFEGYTLNGSPERTAYVLAWFAAYVVACAAFAFALAQVGRSPDSRAGRLMQNLTGPIRPGSSWSWVFVAQVPRGSSVWVGCRLDDGRYVSGPLDYFSADADETADRELTIADPVFVSAAGEVDAESGITRTVLSARHIVRLDVSYLDRPQPPDAEPPAPD